MVKKMVFLWVCECGQERPERQETTIKMQGLRPPIFRRYPARQVTGHLGVHRGQTDPETAIRKIRRVSQDDRA